jgi:hypothetical protein
MEVCSLPNGRLLAENEAAQDKNVEFSEQTAK